MSAVDPSDPLVAPTLDASVDVCSDATSVPRQRSSASRFRFTCPSCLAVLTLSDRRLVVRVEEGTPPAGEVLFICLGCDATVCLGLDSCSVATLVGSGVAVLAAQPSGPPD